MPRDTSRPILEIFKFLPPSYSAVRDIIDD